MKKTTFVLLALVLLAAASCGPKPTPAATPTPSGPRTLTVMTHDSFDAG